MNMLPLIEEMANTLRISSSIVIIIFTIALTLSVILFCSMIFGNVRLGVLFGFIPLSFCGFINIIPIYIGIIYGVFSYITFSLFRDVEYNEVNKEEIDYWTIYSNKMKLAYCAKFGGNNSGFNDEVDKRIAIMVRLRKGYTRSIAQSWLKQMEKFTEMQV